MGTTLEELKERLTAKQGEITALQKRIEQEEAIEARRERFLKVSQKMEEVNNDKLGELSRKVLMRDVFSLLQRHLNVTLTYNPQIVEKSVAELLCLFIEDSPLQEKE